VLLLDNKIARITNGIVVDKPMYAMV
jgi:hypothetical protein